MIALTQIELVVWATVYAPHESFTAAAETVCSLGRLKWPQYDGPYPKDRSETVEPWEAVKTARAALAIEIFEAVKRQNAELARTNEGSTDHG